MRQRVCRKVSAVRARTSKALCEAASAAKPGAVRATIAAIGQDVETLSPRSVRW